MLGAIIKMLHLNINKFQLKNRLTEAPFDWSLFQSYVYILIYVVVDHFYLALLSAHEQTYCSGVTCDSDDDLGLTVLRCQANILGTRVILNKWLAFCGAFWISTQVVTCGILTGLFGYYMAGAVWNSCCLGTFYVHHTTVHHVMSLHAKAHMQGTCVFSWNLLPAVLAKWLQAFMC